VKTRRNADLGRRTMATATAAKFKVLGISDDVTECHCCGKVNLKRTVILDVLDADGGVMDTVHYGRDCAAVALRFRNGRAAEAVAVDARRKAEEEERTRVVVVGENPANPGCLWVVESVGGNGSSVSRLCFAKGTRSAIRTWASTRYPTHEINVRVAR
jgi:hypothetical protein